jgi:type II secretory pathway pseudopilin PulG
MTLLDAIAALVILGLAAVGFLGAFQATSRATAGSTEWVQAVGYAESLMEETKLGAATSHDALPAGFGGNISSEPWPEVRNIERVTVTITLPRGGAFTLHRLVRTQ